MAAEMGSTKRAFASVNGEERRQCTTNIARPHCEQYKGFSQSSLSLDWFWLQWFIHPQPGTHFPPEPQIPRSKKASCSKYTINIRNSQTVLNRTTLYIPTGNLWDFHFHILVNTDWSQFLKFINKNLLQNNETI